MLTTFFLIQVGINVGLILGLVRLLREREATLRRSGEREDRLEALAAELCALGNDMVRRNAATPLAPPRVHEAAGPPPEASSPTPAIHPEVGVHECVGVSERVRGAAALLKRGAAIEQVAAATALLPGEVQVLRNLQRAGSPADRCRKTGRVPAPSRTGRGATARRPKLAQA